ncbi:hypothetical protein COCC4DRAFT_43058, partial [Bipolaris maydis ATCC 48331]
MRFSTITLLALGATASAYVVPNRQVVDNAVKPRMPENEAIQASNLVAALSARDLEARHHQGGKGKGKGKDKGKKKNARDVESELEGIVARDVESELENI